MPNRLAAETSPYLRQHADNPVDWYPWGEEALARARREDKPILLSIGYSACHWCHVMAHESFADAPTAAVMNRLFVNIKVDREERPDLDQIYQTAHQMIARRAGGWPLTMFLTPAGVPFYGGTYFPNTARHGLPGFIDLIERIAEVFATRRGEVEEQGQALVDALAQLSATAPCRTDEFDAAPLLAATGDLARHFDPVHGGFGTAPKFPRPTDLAFLLRRHFRSGDRQALDMVLTTLRRMAAGGIYDQLGGGFCRYSVDAAWHIPHFEKMLYDNALLIGVYVDAWRISGDPSLAGVVDETIEWVRREMTAPTGGFYSSLDADADGEEGAYYVWTLATAKAQLSQEEWALASAHFGLDRAANFEGCAWHLRIVRPVEEVAAAAGLPPESVRRSLAAARAKLLAGRSGRPRPGLDDKCLTSWNALMIAALARAGRAFGRQDWIRMARHSLSFIASEHWRDERLLATSQNGRAHLNAYLDDYAFLLDAVIEMLQADFRTADLRFATRLADGLLAHFADRQHGGFYFTSDDHETLIHRPHTLHDNALPAGSAVAVLGLSRLARLTGKAAYAAAADRALRTQLGALAGQPAGAATLLDALDEARSGGKLVVVRGGAEQRVAWQQRLGQIYAPDALVVWPPDDRQDLPETLVVGAAPAADEIAAWTCVDGLCRAPEKDLESLVATLSQPAQN